MKLLLSCLILGLALGCAAMERLRAEAQETRREFPAPPERLDAPQDSRAIVLLDIDLTAAGSELRVVGAELERGDGAGIRAGGFSEFHLFASSATERGLVLFGSLVPTRYVVSKIKYWQEGGQMRTQLLAYPPEIEATTLELQAGEVRYLHVAAHKPMFASEFEWRLVENEPSRAHEALEWLAQRYPDSSWTKKIRDEIFAH